VLVPSGQQSNYSALHETWETSNSVRRADGHTLAFFNPYFQVRLPSRFYDPALAPVVGRPIAVCYEVTPEGEQASGGACDASTSGGQVTGLTFNSVGSAFNGAGHFVDVNANQLSNSDGAGGLVHGRLRPKRADRAVPRLDPPAAGEDGQQRRGGCGRTGDREQPELRGAGGARP